MNLEGLALRMKLRRTATRYFGVGRTDMMYDQESESSKESAPYKEIFPTAAAMLWQDRKFIPAIYGLLVVTALVLIELPPPDKTAYFAGVMLERLLQLLFTFLVAVRWIKRVSKGPRIVTLGAASRFFLFGLGLWCLFTVPIGIAGTTESPLIASASFFLFGTAVWIGLRYFFYPLPILLGRTPLGAALEIAADIGRGERVLPVKLMIAPCGFFSLLLGIVMALSPDRRDLWTSFAAEFVSGVFWVLATYLSLAASLLRLSDHVWREEDLDPYRTARLSTLEFQGSSWLAKQLRPAHGAGWLLISILVWTVNFIRLFDLPPPGTTKLTGISVHGNTVTVSLHLSDPDYRFNGLQPFNFALAGEQRAVIAPYPESAVVRGAPPGVSALMAVPRDKTELDLELVFKASRSGKDLAALQDLYLWYRRAKLDKITIEPVDVRD